MGEFKRLIVAINDASADGNANWDKISASLQGAQNAARSLSGAARRLSISGGNSPTDLAAEEDTVQAGERTLKTALACIEVSTWLFETGFGDEAEVILRAFATTGFPACDWMSELKAMSRDELSQLGRSARKTSAAVRHEPSSNSNGRESFTNQIHDHNGDHNGDVHKGGGYQNGHHQNGRHQNGYHHANGKGSSHDIVNEQQLNRRRAPAPSSTSQHSTPRRGSMEADVADVEAAVVLFE